MNLSVCVCVCVELTNLVLKITHVIIGYVIAIVELCKVVTTYIPCLERSIIKYSIIFVQQ